MPVAVLFKGLLDHVSDQENLTASQKVGDNECCQCRYKYHSDTADHTRDTQRKNNLTESLYRICSQVTCRVDNIAVDLDQYVIDRKHHERQEVVHHTKDDRIRCIDDLQCRQMQETQHAVDDTVFFKQCLPCQGAEKKVHPHRQDKDQHDKTCLTDFVLAQDHCQRIGKDQTDRGT